jgi:hypothetical protein
METGDAVRLLTPGMRRLLFVAAALVLVAAVQLYVLTDRTDRWFAWTIAPGLSACFLGAGYLSTFFLEFLSARERVWARARMGVPPALVFTALILLATLLHLDRFHLHEPVGAAWFAAWAWLVVYVTVPVALVVLLVRQVQAPGGDPPRVARLPRWATALVGVQAAVALVVGVALFVTPERVAEIWPLELTPLTGRAVGAWFTGAGVGLAQGVLEDDLDRLWAAGIAYALFGALQLVAVARYAGNVDWSRATSWIYVAFMAVAFATGAGAAAGSRRVRVTV